MRSPALARCIAAFGIFAGGAVLLAVPPAGFEDSLVAAIPSPTAIAFTPDGRLLTATQGGTLRVIEDDVLRAASALDLSASICTNSERGVLGVAVDPAFATNHYIYLYYTFNKSGVCEKNTARSPVNRVSRFTLSTASVADRASELVLIDNIPSPNGNHNGGDLHFGPDGYLYVSTGDGGCDYAGDSGCAGSNDASRDQHVLGGKLLRITRDGAIPAGNPFVGSGTARCNVTGRTSAGQKCQETFAWGFRNPFRFAFDPEPGSNRLFVNDVGQDTWEEINQIVAGSDNGWNVREGRCANASTTNCGAPPAGMRNPTYAYGHESGCASITGGAFVPSGVWPAASGRVRLRRLRLRQPVQAVAGDRRIVRAIVVRYRPGHEQCCIPDLRSVRGHAGALLHHLRERRPGAAGRLYRQPHTDGECDGITAAGPRSAHGAVRCELQQRPGRRRTQVRVGLRRWECARVHGGREPLVRGGRAV
jgi:glucose/arabinose dehydrogenase